MNEHLKKVFLMSKKFRMPVAVFDENSEVGGVVIDTDVFEHMQLFEPVSSKKNEEDFSEDEFEFSELNLEEESEPNESLFGENSLSESDSESEISHEDFSKIQNAHDFFYKNAGLDWDLEQKKETPPHLQEMDSPYKTFEPEELREDEEPIFFEEPVE